MRRWSGVLSAAVVLLLAACHDEPVAPEPSFARQPSGPPFSSAQPIDLSVGGTRLGYAVSIDENDWILGWPASNEGVLVWGPGGVFHHFDPVGDIRRGYTNSHGDAVGYQNGFPSIYSAGTDLNRYTWSRLLGGNVNPGWDHASDINDQDLVVGSIGCCAAVWTGLDDTQPALWGMPDYYVGPEAVTNDGFIVGRVGQFSGVTYAWTWQFVSATRTIESRGELPRDPTAIHHAARNINEAGIIVGFVQRQGSKQDYPKYPARWAPSGPQSYTLPPAVLPYYSAAPDELPNGSSLNRCGFTAGTVYVSSTVGQRGFVWDGIAGHEPILLQGLPNSTATIALDINDNGDVVGASRYTQKNRTTANRPTLWRGVVPPCP